MLARIRAAVLTHQWVEAQFSSSGAASTSASPHTAWLWRGWQTGTQTSCWGLRPAFDTEAGTRMHGPELEEIHVIALSYTFRETQRCQHIFSSHTNDVCWGRASIIKFLRSCPKWNDICWSSSSTTHMLKETFHVSNVSSGIPWGKRTSILDQPPGQQGQTVDVWGATAKIIQRAPTLYGEVLVLGKCAFLAKDLWKS